MFSCVLVKQLHTTGKDLTLGSILVQPMSGAIDSIEEIAKELDAYFNMVPMLATQTKKDKLQSFYQLNRVWEGEGI